MKTPEGETPAPSHETASPPKRRWWVKGIWWLGGLFLAVLIVVLLGLTFLFPSELVRKELEVRLSDLLDGPVRIESLSFNVLYGLELKQVDIHQRNHPLIKFDRLNFDYNLFALLKQEIQLNEILIDGAEVSLDLEAMSGAAVEETPVEPPPEPSEPSGPPVLPLSVNLESLEIRHADILVVVDSAKVVTITDLNLAVSGQVTQEQVVTTGSVRIENVDVDLGKKHLRLPIDLTLGLQADLPQQQLRLEEFQFQSAQAMRVNLSGLVENFLDTPTLDISLRDAHINLQEMLTLASDFVPANLKTIQVQGQVIPEVSVQGDLLGSGFTGNVTVNLGVQGLNANLPPFDATMNDLNMAIMLPKIAIKENMPEFGEVTVSLTSDHLAYQDYAVSGFQLDVSGDYIALGPVAASVHIAGLSSVPPFDPFPAQVVPFDVELDAMGNFQRQEWSLKQFVVKLDKLLHVEVNGHVEPVDASSEALLVSLSTTIEPHIEGLVEKVPEKLLAGIGVTKEGPPDALTVKLKGRVDSHYQPYEVDASLGLELHGLTVAKDEPVLEGRIDDIFLTVSGDYAASTGQVHGKLAADVGLAQLGHGGTVSVQETGLSVHSTVEGRLTPTYAIKSMTSEDTVSLRIKNLGYADASLQTTIEDITIFSKTREDLGAQKYWLQELHVSSDPLGDLNAQGSYFLESQEFTGALEVPYVDVGEVLRRVKGPAVSGLHELEPQGTVALSIKGAGRVPQVGEIEALKLPLEADVQLSLERVAGVFAGHRVQGAAGTFAASLSSGNTPEATVKSDIRVADVQLGPGLPISRILDAVAEVDVTSRDFNEVEIDQLHIGMKGANVNVNGAVTGMKNIMANTTQWAKGLGDLFAQINTNISLQLEEFQSVLGKMGWVGSGRAHVDVAVHKKEQGPVDLRLEVGGQDITLSQDGTKVIDLDGAMTVQKHLEWDEAARRTISSTPFNPTDVLAQLRSLTGPSRRVSIARLEAGGFTIENFSSNILFDGQALKIQNLAMNILGGGVGGQIVVTTGKAFGLSARFEAAQLDLNHLLKDEKPIAGDSLIDATVGLSIFFEPESGAVDLSRTELNLFITHIGKEALDRLLQFLDPEGSNPTIVNARSQVRLANPSHVTMQLSRGMMGFDIRFSQGLLSSFRMDRIPVGSITSFRHVTQGIPNWETISQTMALIGAESYGITEEGTLVVQ